MEVPSAALVSYVAPGYYETSANSTGGWPTSAIIATAILAALLLGAGLALIIGTLRGRDHRRRPADSSLH
jgi:hypothetical protein